MEVGKGGREGGRVEEDYDRRGRGGGREGGRERERERRKKWSLIHSHHHIHVL